MKYIEGTPRNQLCLFEEKLDDMIEEENLIRFIDVYVNKLDLIKLGIHTNDKSKGTGYDPYLYLKIYIYSYLNRIRSSRQIERECTRNIELIWLTQQLSPDHWSISNFRKTNKKALKNIFKEFLRFCHKLELLSFDCVAIDGTKMRAQNSKSNIYKKNEIDKNLEKVEQKIDEYITELESNDKIEQGEYDFLNRNIPEKLKQLEKHKDKLEFVKEVFKNNPDIERYFANDPDSKFQKDNGRCVVGYNCQSAVDEKNKIIIATEITNENNDMHQLNNMKEKINDIKKNVDCVKRTVCTADSGYHSELEIIKALEDRSVDIYIPNPKDVKTKEKIGKNQKNKIPSKGYEKEAFIYDKDRNIFICPKQKILKQRWKIRIRNGLKKIRYHCSNCNSCDAFGVCTTDKKGRIIEHSINFEKMQKYRERVESDIGKKIVQKRKELVEHPFGTIKRNFGYTYFMQTGIEKVKAEFSFIAFIYNFKRVINIVGVKKLIEVLN
jgi:transposase